MAESVGTRLQLIYGSAELEHERRGHERRPAPIRSWPLKYGSFFTDEDVKAAAKVVVLGSNVSNTLFGEDVDPTDMQIRVRNQVFRVLGVMSSKGAGGGGMNMDDQVFVPYTTIMKKLTGQKNIQRIYVSARRPTTSTRRPRRSRRPCARRTARRRRRRLHGPDAGRHRRAAHADDQHDDAACSPASPASRWSSAASAS